MNSLSINHKQKGLTLLEILVAMTLGTFLLAGVLQIFQSSKRSYRMQENMSRMQENGRFAMEFISQDLREADYQACATNPNVVGTNANVTNSVTGADEVAAIAPLTLATDSITTQKSDSCKDTNAACLPNACVAACAAACPADSSIIYSILEDTSGQPALFKSTTTLGNVVIPQALVEGIENMQILYGEDTDADGMSNYYVPSGTVVNMNNVVSVRVTLTARTIDNSLTATGDGRLRQTYASTIVLRNRLQ